MTDVVTVVPQSQVTDDSVSLDLQRERTHEYAADLGDGEPATVDLGVHTGFSVFKLGNETEDRIDKNDLILELLDALAAGE